MRRQAPSFHSIRPACCVFVPGHGPSRRALLVRLQGYSSCRGSGQGQARRPQPHKCRWPVVFKKRRPHASCAMQHTRVPGPAALRLPRAACGARHMHRTHTNRDMRAPGFWRRAGRHSADTQQHDAFLRGCDLSPGPYDAAKNTCPSCVFPRASSAQNLDIHRRWCLASRQVTCACS